VSRVAMSICRVSSASFARDSCLAFHAVHTASDAAEGAHMPPNQCSSPFLMRTAIPGAVTYSSLTRTSLTLSRGSNSVMALCGPQMVQPFGLWNPTCLEKT